MCSIMVAVLLFAAVTVVHAKDSNKAFDKQVQDTKREVLSIAKELEKLEEQLLYPSHTQLAIFVSLRKGAGVNFSLASVDIVLDGKKVAHYLYTDSEREALILGGVQRIYTGNVSIGTHELEVRMRGRSSDGVKIDIKKEFSIKKDVKPGIAELLLSDATITLINR